jgi:type I restriction enzyme S subunit
MFDSPAPNEYKPLSEVVAPVNAKVTLGKDPGKPYVGLENIPSRGSKLLSWEKAESSISTNSVFTAGDVLFGKLRPNLRKCVAAQFDGYCSTDVLVLRAKDGIAPDFAVRVLQSETIGAAAERSAIGTKMPRTAWEHLSDTVVFCPDVTEQRKVADVLDSLDVAIQKTEAIVEKLKQVKQGLMNDLLTRGVDANGELRPSQEVAPELYQESPLGWIPQEWKFGPFGSLCSSSAFGPRFPSDAYDENGPLATLRTTDMDDEGEISLATMPRAAINPSTFSEHLLQRGDLVISRSGTCGVTGVFSGHEIPVVPGAFLIRFRLTDLRTNQFFRRYFNSSLGRPRLEKLSEGGVQKNIKGSDVLGLVVPILPSDEAELIADRVLAVEKNIQLNAIQLHKLRQSKAGLMDDLLTGRVRVTPLLAQ